MEIVTWVYPSTWVVKILDFLVGMVVFLGIKVAMIPPWVSIPKDKGATSMSKTSLINSWS